jgi:hypothetical protein
MEIWLAAAFLGAWSPVGAQARICKPVGLSNTGDETAYKSRGARCEGILEREVGGEVIPVVGLVGSFERFDPQRGVNLTLGFSPSTSDSVWIVATSTRPTLHYRMDTAVPAGVGRLSWPVSILRTEGIRYDDLAILAWTKTPGIGDKILLPIAVTQKDTASTASPIVITLLPAKRARALRVSTAEADSTGRASKWIKENDPVPGSDFIEGMSVAVRLPALRPNCLYRVRIGADLAPDTSSPTGSVLTTTTEFLLRTP